jgi:glycosyltransferase involved in cell wall biosynthesis
MSDKVAKFRQPEVSIPDTDPSNFGKKIVVIIPAYKADATLPLVLGRIPKKVYDQIYKILIVEDGGAGIPRSATPALEAQYEKIEVLFHNKNRGYGGAQKSGYARALELGADLCVLLHADGQYAPEIMAKLYAPLVRNEADMVLGSRMQSVRSAIRGGMPLYKVLANLCLSSLENLAYGLNFSEYHSGYMLYSAQALRKIPFQKLSDTFHFDGEMLLVGAKAGLRVADLPIPTFYGDEKSHLRPIKYGFEVLRVIWRFWCGHYDFSQLA